MRAIVVESIGGEASLQDVADPDLAGLAGGSSIIRVRAAVVSHLDVQVFQGTVALRPSMPLVPGTEASGEIVAGDSFAPGTAVRVRGGGIGVRRPGTWADLVVAANPTITPIAARSGVEPDWGLAASYFSPAATAWAAAHEVAAVEPGERVIVTGAAGAVGSMAVQLAARHGCHVVGVVGDERRRDRIPPVAAEATTESALPSHPPMSPDGFDAVIDTVGGTPLDAAIRALRPGGRVAMVGYTAGDTIGVPISELLLREVSLLPVNLIRRGPALVDRGDELFGLLTDGELSLEVHRFALAEVSGAMAALADRDITGRIVLVP